MWWRYVKLPVHVHHSGLYFAIVGRKEKTFIRKSVLFKGTPHNERHESWRDWTRFTANSRHFYTHKEWLELKKKTEKNSLICKPLSFPRNHFDKFFTIYPNPFKGGINALPGPTVYCKPCNTNTPTHPYSVRVTPWTIRKDYKELAKMVSQKTD
jgi:hypothetical protein